MMDAANWAYQRWYERLDTKIETKTEKLDTKIELKFSQLLDVSEHCWRDPLLGELISIQQRLHSGTLALRTTKHEDWYHLDGS